MDAADAPSPLLPAALSPRASARLCLIFFMMPPPSAARRSGRDAIAVSPSLPRWLSFLLNPEFHSICRFRHFDMLLCRLSAADHVFLYGRQ